MIDYVLFTFLGVLFSIPVIAITAQLIIWLYGVVSEYAYTINTPTEIIEHRKLNLMLFCIVLKDKVYKHIAPTYGNLYGFSFKSEAGGWFKDDNKYNFKADKRIEEYLESRNPDLKVVS